MAEYRLTINGVVSTVEADQHSPLLYVLRQMGFVGTRYGCGLEQCGSCRVIVNDKLEYACTIKVGDLGEANIKTIEGLAKNGELHFIQRAFLEENAGQCGYCLSGIIVTASHLLERNPKPDRQEIQQALSGHLCRCGAHNRMIKAIQKAAIDAG